MQIIINGRTQDLDQDTLTYDEVVALADSGRSPKCLHTVIWEMRNNGWTKSGSLIPGQVLKLEGDRVIISAMVTDGA